MEDLVSKDVDSYKFYDENKDYIIKPILNWLEMKVYRAIEHNLHDMFCVFPQVNLQSIILTKNNNRRNDELYRNIDLIIFYKESLRPVIAIEINGVDHYKNEYKKKRDKSVFDILERIHLKVQEIWNKDVYYRNEEEIVDLLRGKSKLLDSVLTPKTTLLKPHPNRDNLYSDEIFGC